MEEFDLVIIGTGSGNSILTPEFDDWNVAIVERGVFGGTCLNVGCIPSKMLVIPADRVVEAAEATELLGVEIDHRGSDWPAIRDRIFGRIDPIADGGRGYRKSQSHVTVFDGDARFVGERQLRVDMADGSVAELGAKQVVLAAGARPMIPAIPGLANAPFHTSDSIMRIDSLPEHLIVLGGGFIAAELGHVFSALGSRVTVIHRGDRMLRHDDDEISERFTDCFGERVDLRLCSTARSVSYEAGEFTLDLKVAENAVGRNVPTDPGQVSGDALLVGTGRLPNGAQLGVETIGVKLNDEGYVITDQYLATGVPGVWALGDIRNPLQLKHLANQEARVISHNLLHPDDQVAIDQDIVPRAVFSHPQIGSVGATEQQLVAQQRGFITGRCNYGSVAYGWALEDSTGFAKILIEPTTRKILGAHIIGPQASTLIQQLVQAMAFDLPADRVAQEQIWCHPALPELIENALLDALG